MVFLSDSLEMIEGFLLQASLIFALGAQNIFLLESGLRRQRPLFVATIFGLSDSLLVMLGVLGVGTVFASNPWLKILFGVIGVIFIITYGIQKCFEQPTAIVPVTKTNAAILTIKQTLIKSLAFTFLNPHVYLDTLVLNGSYSAEFSSIDKRTIFGIGAIIASWLWFFSLAYGSIMMSRFFSNAKRMRCVLRISGLILIVLGLYLASDVYNWIREVI